MTQNAKTQKSQMSAFLKDEYTVGKNMARNSRKIAIYYCYSLLLRLYFHIDSIGITYKCTRKKLHTSFFLVHLI